MKSKSLSKTAAVWRLFLFLAVLFLAMTGCGPDPFYIRVALIEGVPETGEAGTPLTLTGNVRPNFASNKNIVWLIKDAGTTRASISGNILNAAAGGTVIIRAIIANGIAEGKEYSQDFRIVFTAGETAPNIYSVTFVTNGGGDIAPQSVKEGQTAQKPDDPVKSGFDFVNWYDNEDLTDPPYNFDTPVTEDITLYAYWIVHGTAVPVTGISLNKASLSLTVGDTETLTATISPYNATNRAVSWSSSDHAVATVSTTGLVTAVGAGAADITVTTADGGFTATCGVIVTNPAVNKDARITLTGVEYDTLAEALTAASNGTADSPTEIIILRDITATSGYTIYRSSGMHIKLTVESGKSFTITSSAGDFGLFTVNSYTSSTKSSLTIGDISGNNGNLTLDGKGESATSNRQGVRVLSEGIFTMHDGVTITGYNNNGNGGGVSVTSGTFCMNGGKICNNNSASGGGVFINSRIIFEMKGGEIYNNTASGNGGGVAVSGTVEFKISGGKIYGNTASGKGGGVNISGGGTFTMSGGTIYGIDDTAMTNKAPNGVAADQGAAVNIESGTAKYDGAYGTGTIATTNDTLPNFIISPIGIEMVSIPAGTFMMGSPESEPNRGTNETQHSVTLTKSFYMSKYQVTQKQWVAVMGDEEDRTTDTYGKGDNYPVYYVNWYDALVFCNKLSMAEGLNPVYTIDGSTNPSDWGAIPTTSSNTIWNAAVMDTSKNGYRLPTEAEWEYACRGSYANKATETNTKPFGIGDGTKMISGMANFRGTIPYDVNHIPAEYTDTGGTYLGKLTAVGSYAANNYGLYDMHGNLYEWCWDWHETYPNGAQTDPVGAFTGSDRVKRGGSYSGNGQFLRSAYRPSGTSAVPYPYNRNASCGFRLVRSGE